MLIIEWFLNDICERDVDEMVIPKCCRGKGLGCNLLYSVERDAQLNITLAATTRAQGHMIPRHVTRSRYVLHEMWDTSKLTRQVTN